jgi:hypothetical protein
LLNDGKQSMAPNRRRKRKKVAKKAKTKKANPYTKPGLRKRIVSQVKSAATHGTKAGQWSARKAQLVAKKYKAAGGGYK